MTDRMGRAELLGSYDGFDGRVCRVEGRAEQSGAMGHTGTVALACV